MWAFHKAIKMNNCRQRYINILGQCISNIRPLLADDKVYVAGLCCQRNPKDLADETAIQERYCRSYMAEQPNMGFPQGDRNE